MYISSCWRIFFLWLPEVWSNPLFFLFFLFCFLFFFFFGSVALTFFFPLKYLRPLVPESDIVAGNTNEEGVQDYGTAEWTDYLSEISWGDGMGWDTFFLFFFLFRYTHDMRRKETCSLSWFVVVYYHYHTSSNISNVCVYVAVPLRYLRIYLFPVVCMHSPTTAWPVQASKWLVVAVSIFLCNKTKTKRNKNENENV